MSDVDEHGRPEPPSAGDEAATLLGFLEYQRATFAWKTGGLGTDGLRATVGSSAMTLGGMSAHLALVEDWWCSRWLLDRDPAPPWDTVAWDEEPDADWALADRLGPDDLRRLWEEAVGRSREAVAEALDRGGLGGLARRRDDEGRSPSLRWVLVHLIEEYARHNGHADLLRESVDGQTGE